MDAHGSPLPVLLAVPYTVLLTTVVTSFCKQNLLYIAPVGLEGVHRTRSLDFSVSALLSDSGLSKKPSESGHGRILGTAPAIFTISG